MTYTQSLYETDEVAWSTEQVHLLQEHRWDELDIEHIIEEIADVGGRHKDRIESDLEILLMHLLKREYQPEKHTTSWDITIQTTALNIRKEIARRPSLRRHFIESFAPCYNVARELAEIETHLGLERFPLQCPQKIRDEAWQRCEIE